MRIRSPFVIRCISRAAVTLLRFVCWTCRKEIHASPGTNLYDSPEECFLYSAWHDAIILSLLIKRPAPNMAALVSQHRDGSYIAELLNAIGVKPVRGSTSRGGAKALREMMEITRENHVAITSDGPRGPRREVKSGLVFLAAKTGTRIVPAAYAVSSSWKIEGSWTDMQIPKPFSRIVAVGEDPIEVPKKIDREGIERFTEMLQQAMDRVTFRAEAYARGEDPDAAAEPSVEETEEFDRRAA